MLPTIIFEPELLTLGREIHPRWLSGSLELVFALAPGGTEEGGASTLPLAATQDTDAPAPKSECDPE